jgi:broad specificity phosphatase PhoE
MTLPTNQQAYSKYNMRGRQRRLSALLSFLSTTDVSAFVTTTTFQSKRRQPSFLWSSTQIPDELRLWKDSVPAVKVVDCMPDPLPSSLKHSYYLLRHGQSTANVDDIISSDRFSLAYTNQHGLTAVGIQQGRDAAARLLELMQAKAGDTVVFVSSPFARARQTAQACLEGLLGTVTQQTNLTTVTPHVYYHDLLLERSFGRLDGAAIYTYAYVWPLDKMNVTHTTFGVESVAAVCTRWRQLILDLECAVDYNTNQMVHVVCVSHADVLQIAQLYAAGVPNVGEFSSYRFANGEVRRMEVGTGVAALPLPAPLPAPQRGTGR